jgi:hypothetical protein
MGVLRACAALGMLAALSGWTEAQSTLEITSPANGTVVNPGHIIGVTVLAAGVPFELVGIAGQDPIGFGQARREPPYQFDIEIPQKTTPGEYTLTAVGKPVSGEMLFSRPISIDVERPDARAKITINHRQLGMQIGWDLPLDVYGTYADGSEVNLTKSRQTTYVSESPAIATVSSEGLVKAISPGSTEIVIDGKIAVPVTVQPLITIVPSKATLKASQTRYFTARVTRPPNGKVTWMLNPNIGSVVDGKYTAPDAVASQQTVAITATSVDDPSLSVTATITLSPAVSIEVVPAWAVLYKAQTQQFTATTANAGTEGVKWSLIPSGAGSIDSTGLYTAPDPIEKTQPVKIVATSAARPAISGSTTIYISPRPFKLFCFPLALSLAPGKTTQATVMLLATDRFVHPIALSVDGAPIGIRTTLSEASLTGNSQASLTFTYENETVPASYKITVTARDTVYPALTDSETFTLHVGP